MLKTKFNKPPLNIQEQISLLKARGLIINDEALAEYYLTHVGYYRLSGYWFNYQDKRNNNNFINGITFEDIVSLYKFDTKLRSLFLDALEKIEICLGTLMGNYMVNKYDPFWYENPKLVTSIFHKKTKQEIFNHEALLQNIDNDIAKQKKTEVIINFYEKYSNPRPPFWMILQVISFGDLSKIYKMIADKKDRQNIAGQLEFTSYFLESLLNSMAYIRNICAHYSRLWSRKISVTPADIEHKNIITKYNYKFHSDTKQDKSLFPLFYTVSLFLKQIQKESKWVFLTTQLIEKYAGRTKLISYEKMGFPKDWQELPLFKDILNNSK